MNGGWRVAIGAVVVAALAAGVLLLRALTESRHEPTGPGSRTLVEVTAHTNLDRLGPGLDDLVEAAATTCRIELGVEPVGPVAQPLADGRYRTVYSPALDETERLRYEGCLEDWRVDHLRIDVVTVRTWDGPG